MSVKLAATLDYNLRGPDRMAHARAGGAGRRRTAVVTAALLFAGALVLRSWGLEWGLPAEFSGDEVTKRDTALRLPELGFLHPVDHPSFVYNSLFVLYSIARVAGDWTVVDFHYLGRAWMAVLGSLTVVAVWRLGRRLAPADAAAGVLAAVFLAVLPLHTASSRYIKEDIPLGLMTTVTAIALVAAAAAPSRGRLAIAGLSAGLAFSTKYTGAVLLGPVLVVVAVAAWRGRRGLQRTAGDLAAVGAAFAAGFALWSPVLVAHPWALVEGFRAQAAYAGAGHDGVAIDPWSEWWTYYLRQGLIPGMTWPLALLSGAGLWLMARLRHGWVAVLTVVVLYVVVERSPSKPLPFAARYLVPLVPLLCVAAALPAVRAARWLRARLPAAAAYGLVGAVTIAPPLAMSALIALEALHDTRTEAGRWMERHVPAGSRIVVTEGAGTLPASRYWSTRWLVEDRDIGAGLDASWAGEAPPYFVMSSFKYDRFIEHPTAVPDRTRFYRTVMTEYDLVQAFRPRWFTYGRHSPEILIYRPPCPACPEPRAAATGPTDPANELPFGWVDAPAPGAVVGRDVVLRGWALDDTGVAEIRVFLDRRLWIRPPRVDPRPDVEAAHPQYPRRAGHPGWHLTLALPPGTVPGEHEVLVQAVDVDGASRDLATVRIVVAPGRRDRQEPLP